MSTEKQKEAARRNIEKAREVQSERAHGEQIPRSSAGMSTAEKDRLPDVVLVGSIAGSVGWAARRCTPRPRPG
jgi:hypothetical protein